MEYIGLLIIGMSVLGLLTMVVMTFRSRDLGGWE